MSCEPTRAALDAFLDDELGPLDARAIEEHLASCASCTAQAASLRALRTGVRAGAPYYRAPAALRTWLDGEIGRRPEVAATTLARPPASVISAAARPRSRAAIAALAAFVVGALTTWSLRSPRSDAILDEAVADHVRSLMAAHLTDVPSTDRHTVRPWFAGRLDVAPPVVDLASEGYELIGGRLDYLGQRPAAALVYRRKQHVINVFVRPGGPRGTTRERAEMRRGYNLVAWGDEALSFVAVSDLSAPDLRDFAASFRAGTATAPEPKAP